MSERNGASAPSGVGASKLFEKLTAKDWQGLFVQYVEARYGKWPPVEVEFVNGEAVEVPREPTAGDVRAMFELDLSPFERIARDGIWIDGEVFDNDDLTFGEQEELTQLVRELSGDDESSFSEAPMYQAVPALVTVIRRRANPKFSLDEAKKLKPSELVKPDGASAD